MSAGAWLSLWLPGQRERLDALLCEEAGPLVREAARVSGVRTIAFERINKPEWGIRVWASGVPAALDQVQALAGSGVVADRASFDGGEEDKWVGGMRERERLGTFHQLDSLSAIDFLEAPGFEESGARARFSLVFIERLLELFGLDEAQRIEFDRRGFLWAFELGRWDRGVLDALEEKFRRQEEGLSSVLSGADPASSVLWGSARAADIGRRLLVSLAAPIATLSAAARAGELERPLLEYALFAAHAHANRIGVHATQEATLRYLSWRARGGGPWSLP